jgi:hypothetical protein
LHTLVDAGELFTLPGREVRELGLALLPLDLVRATIAANFKSVQGPANLVFLGWCQGLYMHINARFHGCQSLRGQLVAEELDNFMELDDCSSLREPEGIRSGETLFVPGEVL